MAADPPSRPRFDPWLTLCAVPAFALLAGLGVWQLERLEWKEALIAERAAGAALPALPIGEVSDWRRHEHRRVAATGRYLHDRALRVHNRIHRGRAGLGLVTPLSLGDGTAVLVDRGWIPPGHEPERGVSGETSVVGALRTGGRANPWIPDNSPGDGEWFYVDVPQMAGAAGLGRVRPFYLQLLPAEGRSGFPAPADAAAALPNRHLGYAITWFALAAALAAVFAVRQLRGG